MPVGFIGLEVMGRPMALNLARAAFLVLADEGAVDAVPGRGPPGSPVSGCRGGRTATARVGGRFGRTPRRYPVWVSTSAPPPRSVGPASTGADATPFPGAVDAEGVRGQWWE
ncbi:NAD(P)-binding domain-containing protein [Streptomyces flavalbus]|uniref:NAD(P)-binding domain-containing protein n=1 Tax=Streptomyces flavalbus TaxID=2665155 RepID=A0ABW2WIQ3_9ACTN